MFIKIFDTLYNTDTIRVVHPVDKQGDIFVVQVDFYTIRPSGSNTHNLRYYTRTEPRKYTFITQEEANTFFLDIETKLLS